MDQNRLALLLSTLYSSSDNEAIRSASSELNTWQQKTEAWAQADQLLSTPGLQPEFYYFFAQTLKTKIQYDMYQLPATSISCLRDSLVQKLLAVAQSSAAKATRKQLCLAIADLAIQSVEVWPNAVPDMVSLLQGDHFMELLDVLKLLPEETENLKLMTENSKRNLSRQRCLEYYYSVLELLNARFLSKPSPELVEAILGCFLSWLKFDSPPIQYSLVDSPIINFCLSQLNAGISSDSITVNDTIIEILTEIVQTSSAYRNKNDHNPLIELKVFPQLSMTCKTLLGMSNLEDHVEHEEESMKAIVRLFAAIGEGMKVKIASEFSTNSDIQQFLLLLLRLFGMKNIDISQLCAHVFEDFLEATAPSDGDRKPASPFHEKLFETLVLRLSVSTEPSFDGVDPFGTVDSDFFHFRTSVVTPLLYSLSREFLGRSVGAERLVRGLINNPTGNNLALQEAFALAVKDQVGGSFSDPTATLKEAMESLIEILPRMVDVGSIHSCSLLDTFRRRALLVMTGSLGNWIRTETQLFALIDVVAQVLIRPTVMHRSIHYAAAGSFRDLCFNNHCKGLIVGNASAVESITKLFTQTSTHLGMREHSMVTEGITSILSACSDDNLFNNMMRNMILIPLVQSGDQLRRTADVANCGLVIDRITAVLQSLLRLRPGSTRYDTVAEVVVNHVWPMLSGCMETFRAESDLVEKACRLIKHAMRSVSDVFKVLVVPIGQILVRDFPVTQHSSYLYTAEVLAHQYGHDLSARAALSDIFSNLATQGVRITHQRLTSAGVFESGDTVDELIEDLFGMIERFLRFSPTIVVKSQAAIGAVLNLLVPVFSRMRREETIEAVSAFTEQIYGGEWTHSIDIGSVTNDEVMAIRSALIGVAPLLVQELIGLLVSVCNRSMRIAIPSILLTLNNFEHNLYKADWIVKGLQRVPVSIMTERDKEAALQSLISLDDERIVQHCVEDILYRSELVGRRMRNELK